MLNLIAIEQRKYRLAGTKSIPIAFQGTTLLPAWFAANIPHSMLRCACMLASRRNLKSDGYRLPLVAGFSLLEILAVLAIVAVLSAIAVPSYAKYITRAKLTELFVLADTHKLKLVDKVTDGAAITCHDAGGKDAQPLSKNVENIISWIDKNEYAIQIKATQKMLNLTGTKDLILEFRGIDRGDSITWECLAAKAHADLLSGRCVEKEVVLHRCQ